MGLRSNDFAAIEKKLGEFVVKRGVAGDSFSSKTDGGPCSTPDSAVEDFKWRALTRRVGRRPFKPQTVLLQRRTPVGSV
jgi:hypothetical protein